ncbi:hypothetical protein CRI94_16165 [Longibacter salinarum]|uniref:Peptidase M10 metallopeptidase domain-containing protein n=2 Tax=Longibacter salinarum TaxID=1850348 RepID=A0A2A8CU89_9BACT|nr:hypothetical protein CRI94_16165 [Longibacter salinarum]
MAAVILVSACDTEPSAVSTLSDAPDSESSPLVTGDKALADLSSHKLVLGVAEYLTDPASGEAGRVEWFQKDLGNANLGHDFVYNDPRATWDDVDDLTFAVKQGATSSDANLTNQSFWFEESFRIWESEQCSGLVLEENVSTGNTGVIETFFAGGGIDVSLIEADVTQVGFRGVGPLFAPGSSTLGVAYTLFWTDASGNLTDIDGNGKIDAAFREIYYNDQYTWADDGTEGPQANGTYVFDFPSVAIHEAGHGLSAAHFGSIGVKDGFLFAKPRAVMNAVYGGTLRDLLGRDVGSHCSNWAEWPYN